MTVAVDSLTYAEAARIVREHYRINRHRLTWVYAIQAGDDGPVKIGLTKDPDERLKTLQVGNAAELRGLGAWRDFPEEEKRLHDEFAYARIRGEWFKPVPELIEWVESAGASFWWKTDPLPEDFEEAFPECV